MLQIQQRSSFSGGTNGAAWGRAQTKEGALKASRPASWGRNGPCKGRYYILQRGEDMAFVGGPVHLEAAKNSSLGSCHLSKKNSNLPTPQKSCKAKMGMRNQSSLWHIPFIRNREERKSQANDGTRNPYSTRQKGDNRSY